MIKFPRDFLWGASTAAHQVEGGTHNSWSEWERRHAEQLAATAVRRYRRLPAWPKIQAQATAPANYLSGRAVDHYHLYEADFDLLKRLHMNSFRFSIEWSRLEPQEGRWSDAEVAHYGSYIKALRKRDIEPVLTLWHWTLPVWFADKGGFAKQANLRYFERFVRKVVETYGSDIRYIITLNEPNMYTAAGYLAGVWPPQLRNPIVATQVYRNLIEAHRLAYYAVKERRPAIRVGLAMARPAHEPRRAPRKLDALTATMARYLWCDWFLDHTRDTSDFIGVNYYTTDYYKGLLPAPPKPPLNDLGWPMEPGGLLLVLERLHNRYHKPLIITENGVADAQDAYRQWWIEETIKAMQAALEQGIDLQGYLHWSLLDNFEWSHGWWPEFGLVAVDREHGMKRTMRPSAQWFGEWLARTVAHR